MKATILTILPHPGERQVQVRPAAAGQISGPQGERLVPAVTSAPGHTIPSIESVILHKLLAELEAREVARVPQPYLVEQLPAARHTALIRTLWGSLWALSIVFCVVVVKYVDSQQTARTVDAAQAQSINNVTAAIDVQKTQFSNMVESLQGLAAVIASTSARTAAIPGMLRRLTSDLKQTTALPVIESGEPAPEPEPATVPAILTPGQQGGSIGISMGGHRHPPMEDSIAPSDVVVHHNYLGMMDYWLVPRVVSGVWIMTKVVPIAEGPAGILVHDVAEVKDYIVTPKRDWIAAPEANENR